MFWFNKRKDFQVSELHMLIHPFWGMDGEELDKYASIWTESIRKAGENEGTYAFIDLPFRVYANPEHEKIIVDAAIKHFKGRFALQRDGLEFRTGSPDLKAIEAALRNSDEQKITARGGYTQRCVLGNLAHIARQCQVDFADCFVDLRESVDSGYSFPIEKTTLDNFRAADQMMPLPDLIALQREVYGLIEERNNKYRIPSLTKTI